MSDGSLKNLLFGEREKRRRERRREEKEACLCAPHFQLGC
jgi:hypothetical protein